MKVLLVYRTMGLGASYSCGVGYIAAVLKEAGHDVSYRNLASLEEVGPLCEFVAGDRTRVVALAATSCQLEQLKQVVPRVRAVSNAVLVCGGIHPTVQPDCIEEIAELDVIVRGEGEYPLLDLVNAVQAGRDFSRIPNLWVRQDGAIVRNDLRPLNADLDALPFPELARAETQRAIDDQAGMHRMIFSRGCSFRCPYCSNHALSDIYWGKGVYHRLRSPAKALEEIQRDRMKAAGAKGGALGIEHGDEKFRKTVLGRGHANEEIRRTVALCRDAGIREVYGQVMIGLPFETIELHLVLLC